jgi:hypothetical protein
MSTSRDYHPYLIESLKDPTESAAFLEAVLEDCTPEELDLALTDIAAAHTQTDDRLGLLFSHIGHHISLMKQPPSPAMTFSETIEAVKNLSTDEKLEVQQLLKQYLRDNCREEIYHNTQAAQAEQQAGTLKFSSDINELKQLMEEDASV